MRGPARFASVRRSVALCKRWLQLDELRRAETELMNQLDSSLFQDFDVDACVHSIRSRGYADGFRLPTDTVQSVAEFANDSTMYAFREPALGFKLRDRVAAENQIGRPILLAQYFNTRTQCPTINQIAIDPTLTLVAARYLENLPQLVGVNLWWTFPVQANRADQIKHAHVFHRDIDDFRFLKFFFYINDVPQGEGAHMLVPGSHTHAPHLRASDRWKTRRYTDEEINDFYGPQNVLEVSGSAGSGFAEDTLCVHKGATPISKPRLLLQVQFALFDYGSAHDIRAPERLKSLT